jgi:hypothetical protein
MEGGTGRRSGLVARILLLVSVDMMACGVARADDARMMLLWTGAAADDEWAAASRIHPAWNIRARTAASPVAYPALSAGAQTDHLWTGVLAARSAPRAGGSGADLLSTSAAGPDDHGQNPMLHYLLLDRRKNRDQGAGAQVEDEPPALAGFSVVARDDGVADHAGTGYLAEGARICMPLWSMGYCPTLSGTTVVWQDFIEGQGWRICVSVAGPWRFLAPSHPHADPSRSAAAAPGPDRSDREAYMRIYYIRMILILEAAFFGMLGLDRAGRAWRCDA